LLGLGLLGGGLVGLWRALVQRLGPERWSTALMAASLWGLAELLLAKGPLFWIGLGAAALPGDRALAGLAPWLGVMEVRCARMGLAGRRAAADAGGPMGGEWDSLAGDGMWMGCSCMTAFRAGGLGRSEEMTGKRKE
jgi:hypothetical protein